MAVIYYDRDIKEDCLKGRTIAILGFGSQGHAHALNLKEGGYEVVVGLRENSDSHEKAQRYGLRTMTIKEAVKSADVIAILIPDEKQSEVFERDIKNYLKSGKMLIFAHGFSIHFSRIIPPETVDVAMIAPKGPGNLVRREFVSGRGVPALIAVYQNYTKKAKDIALSYAHGIGATRAGVIETTFKEETETDLFGEQAVLCGGLTSLMKAGFEVLVEAGYQPEIAYFECINEMKLIVDLIYEGGFSLMRHSISNTAEYGDYISQDKIITEQTRRCMREILNDIQSGKFAKEWILENEAGKPFVEMMRNLTREHQLEKTGEKLRKMMPWLKNNIKS